MGHVPRDIHMRLIDNKLFVHLQGVLTAVEQRLTKSDGNGAELLKHLRSYLVFTGRLLLEAMVGDGLASQHS